MSDEQTTATDPAVGNRVHEPLSGLVGTVTDWWRDDRGIWVEVRYDDAAGLLGEEFILGDPAEDERCDEGSTGIDQ